MSRHSDQSKGSGGAGRAGRTDPLARAARRGPRRWWGAALAVLSVAACAVPPAGGGSAGPGAPGAQAPHPPREERIELRVVPVPSTVPDVRFPWYSHDGQHILFSGTPGGGDRVELLSIREDGTGFRCLTCGVAPEVAEPLLKPMVFPDDRRVLLRVGEQNPVQAADHAVLECRPSVGDCAEAELVPIAIPPPGGAVVRQDQRELRIAPDGEHVGFTQVRATATGGSAMTAAVATLARTEGGYELRDARVVRTGGELKGFTRDGQAVHVADFTSNPHQAANPDVFRIDLRTGDEARVTYHDDYDEPLELSPDGRWYVVGSGRTAGLFATVSQLRRPNLIATGLEPLAAALFVHHRQDLLEPWLVRAGTERTGATGQRLNAASDADGYSGRAIANWHPDGTRVVFAEGLSDPAQPPQGDTRIVVAHLVERRPGRPHPHRPVPAARRTPEPTWAPPLLDFVPPDPPAPASRDGRRRGSVEIVAGPAPGDPTRRVLQVTYHDFSDDGRWIIDGTERAVHGGGLAGGTHYTADLTLTGRHHGHLRADARISVAGITGSIDSEVDGHRLHLPAPSPDP